MVLSLTTVFSQNIMKGEYFIDLDPGPGNGTAIPGISPGDIVNFSFDISTSGLTPGFHFVNTRVTDADGKWSRYETRTFYLSSAPSTNTTNITAAEYFIDSDPAPGNGTPINIGAAGALVNFVVNVPAGLGSGFHWLGIRVKDEEGKWSIFEERSFYVIPGPVDAPPIVAAEYYYDVDPGIGNGSPLVVSPTGDIISQTFLVPVPIGLSQGNHVLAIRVKDQQGHWSFFAKDTITVNPVSGSITCPGNVTVDPITNNCKAIVHNIDAVGLPADDSSYTHTLSGATTGNGIGTASGQLFNAGVTTVTYSLINAPSISCSFTVTVNSSVTPTASISSPTTAICEGMMATFVCTYTGGGFSSTSWQWKRNGLNVGTNSNIYRDSTLQHSDTITVSMTSAISCAVPQTVTSAPIIMTVWDTITPSVIIAASATSICPGQQVTFTVIPTNAGSNPIYDWFRNGSVVASGITYQTSTLANGDSVYVMLHNTTDCITISPVKSNVVYMTTSQMVTPSLTMAASSTTICTGQMVTFTASPTNGGTTPIYQWKRNGVNIPGATNSTYQSSSLVNGDVIRVAMTSSLNCANPQTVLSYDSVIMIAGSTPVTPMVTISADYNPMCAGGSVTFTATPTNGGSVPGYQWKVNGVNVGSNESSYASANLQNGDVINVVMTSSLSCTTTPVDTSNSITMIITPEPVTVYPDADGDGYGRSSGGFISCAIPAGYVANNTDCNDNNAAINPGATEICGNGIDDDCDGQTDETCGSPDNDSDGYTLAEGDCNDNNASIHPGATEVCGNSIDDDCDGQTDEACGSPDNDNDGYTVAEGDCNDNNASIHPGATEVCGNSIDDDCDGQADEACGSPDNDNDGYTLAEGDCNDNNASIHPGATEVCGNGIDEDCDGNMDENCTEELPVLLIKTHPVKEGDAGYTILNVEVKLDRPAFSPVTVNYSTSNANAIAGSDYVAANGVMTIPVGSVFGSVQVRIIGDLLSEHNESFWINFSNPINAILGNDPRARIMIIDDDKGKPNSAAGNNEKVMEQVPLKIPTVTKRNQVWMIPQIGNYENEVLILNVQGQIVNRFINYKNQTSVGNIACGLYIYRVRITESGGQHKYYAGRLLITE